MDGLNLDAWQSKIFSFVKKKKKISIQIATMKILYNLTQRGWYFWIPIGTFGK